MLRDELVGLDYDDSLEWIEESESDPGISSATVADMLRGTGDWVPVEEVITGTKVPWRPHLRSRDGGRVLHIHLARELRQSICRRLDGAVSEGIRVVIALELDSLCQEDTVEFLVSIDAEVIVIGQSGAIGVRKQGHILGVIGELSIPIECGVRARVARRVYDSLGSGSNHEKGRRLERLLTFLLGQVADFDIVDRNFRGDTYEIDIVIQVDSSSTRCWYRPGSPLIMVEARNRRKRVDQQALNAFYGKCRTKRDSVRLGMMFSTSGFTSAAEREELRYSLERVAIVMVDASQLRSWIDSPDPDKFLEDVVRMAMLR